MAAGDRAANDVVRAGHVRRLAPDVSRADEAYALAMGDEPAEVAEAEALRDLFAAGADLDAEVAEIGGAVCAAFPAAPAIPMLNHALLVGERAPAGDDDVA